MIPKILIFIKYTFGGALSYGLKITITIFLTEVLGWYYLYSFIIALLIALAQGFWYSSRITFQASGNFYYYLFYCLFFHGLDIFLVKFFTEILNFHYLISISIISLFIFLAKFLVFDKLIFKNA